MQFDALLDVPCSLNHRITSSIKSADSLAVFGGESPVELSLSLFQVLMIFAEKRTPRQALEILGIDLGIDDFGRIISGFVEHGLLRPEQPVREEPNLRSLLNSKIFADTEMVGRISQWLQQGRAILIQDAFPGNFAEDVHHALHSSQDWTPAEGGHDFFHYRASVINHLEARSPALAECCKVFRSSATAGFISEISGQNCDGETQAAAAWYRPGEYALPHDDSRSTEPRSVAYVWYLTKDWRQEWGGALFWCPTGQYILPRFNVLLFFRAMPQNLHFICPVAQGATSKRLTINGFWSRSTSNARIAAISPDTAISLRAYGQAAPGPVIVL